MKLSFYLRLAITNIFKNKKSYLPYIISNIAVISVFYCILALTDNLALYATFGLETLGSILMTGEIILAFFSMIFLFYTNSFLFKRRKKELGLYNVLGMEKRHLGRVVALETILISSLSLLLGLGFGVLFYKFSELLLFKILNQPIIEGFHLSVMALIQTIVTFATIFLLTFIYTLWQLRKVNAIELIAGAKQGEKEPKASWLVTMIGLITMGSGYYLAQTCEPSIDAITVFFTAVFLVMIGTYCLFTSIIPFVLKLLKKNRKFYYQPTHFMTVSQMLYRMKQNAVGLANICILSTMFIVTLSTTTALYVGIDDEITTRFPYDYNIELTTEAFDEVEKVVNEVVGQHGFEIARQNKSEQLSYMMMLKGNDMVSFQNDDFDGEIVCLYVIPDQYLPQGSQPLAENEIALCQIHDKTERSSLTIDGKTFQIKEMLPMDENSSKSLVYTYKSFYVYMPRNVINTMFVEAAKGTFNFDLKQVPDATFNQDLKNELGQKVHYMEIRNESIDSFYEIYGGLFFIGLFLGSIFLIATVLIIYYKQISEGYDDASRFEIMEKVGLSQQEIKKTIQTQILFVFFLPLAVACCHVAFAFNLIKILLSFLNLHNTTLFMYSCMGIIAVFSLCYCGIYFMTSKEYYKIVSHH